MLRSLAHWPWLGARPVAWPAWLRLSLLGGLSVGVMWLGLVQPYNLFALRLLPLRSIPQLTADRPLAQAGFVLTLAALSGLYYLAWRVCRPALDLLGSAGPASPSRRSVWVALAGSLLALNGMMLWLYPIGAADVFDNIVRGRITAVHGGNPFYDLPSDYPRDRFRYYAAWPGATSAYGPLWEALAAGAARLGGDDRLTTVLVFKGLGLLAYAGSAGLIALILRRRAPDRMLQGVCLFAWNPLVLYETAGNAHNDIFLAFFILLAVWALQRRFFTLAVLGLVCGTLVKFIPVLLLPLALAYSLRRLTTGRARLHFLASSAVVGAAVVVVTVAPFWRGGDFFALARRTTLFTASLPAVAQVHLEPLLGRAASQRSVAGLAAGLLVVVVAYQTGRVWRAPDWLAPVRAATHVLLFYLLLACLWFQPWYTIWPLALAALLPEGAVARTVVLLSYAAAWKAIFFDFFIYRGGPLPPAVWRETWLAPATLGLVWLYVAYRIGRRGWLARRRAAVHSSAPLGLKP